MYYELNAKDIQQHTDILVKLQGEFAYFFCTSTRNVAPQALDYLKGQLLLESRLPAAGRNAHLNGFGGNLEDCHAKKEAFL